MGELITSWMRVSAISIAIVCAAAMRILPHPPNFAPIGAMALFGGAYLRPAWLAITLPIAALLVSDAVIGFYAHMEWVYISFGLTTLLGSMALNRRTPLRIGAAAVASSMLFYLVTNFAVWLYSANYPHTAAGLMTCYAAGIPFFHNTVFADLVYSAVLFGGFAVFERAVPKLRMAGEVRAAL